MNGTLSPILNEAIQWHTGNKYIHGKGFSSPLPMSGADSVLPHPQIYSCIAVIQFDLKLDLSNMQASK